MGSVQSMGNYNPASRNSAPGGGGGCCPPSRGSASLGSLAVERFQVLRFHLPHPSTTLIQSDKMAPVKKSKATKTSENINSKLQLVVKSGKVGLYSDHMRWRHCITMMEAYEQYTLGYKQALKQLRSGKGELSAFSLLGTGALSSELRRFPR